MRSRTSRRNVLAAAMLAGPGFEVVGQGWRSVVSGAAAHAIAPTAAQDAGTPEAEEVVGEVEAPHWLFTVLSVQDPYAGEVSRPTEPEPGTRYVAAEVVITNASDQPLEFGVSDVRLVDDQGVEYNASSSVDGEEPRLVGQNLPDGERTRGMVWFVVPEDAVISELKLIGPPPQLRVELPAPSSG